MDKDHNQPIVPSSGGFFDQIGSRVKLIIRLMKDRRVNPLLKLLPVGSLLYLLIPDFAPGPIDDAAIIWIGAYLFVELCPPEIVEEHRRELDSIIEGQFREVSEDSDPTE
ncbi:MAG: hypothetical protein ACLFWD_08715 [Anaerolineales bacterium]